MKKSQFYILLIFVVIISSFLSVMFYNYYNIYKIDKINMSLIVKDFIGIALSTKEITFGAVMPGGSSNVDIFLDNEYNRELRVLLMPEGNIAKFVKFSNNNFILGKNETKKIKVNAFAPKDTEFGNYTGILKVVYYRI